MSVFTRINLTPVSAERLGQDTQSMVNLILAEFFAEQAKKIQIQECWVDNMEYGKRYIIDRTYLKVHIKVRLPNTIETWDFEFDPSNGFALLSSDQLSKVQLQGFPGSTTTQTFYAVA